MLFNVTNTGYAGGNNIALKCALAWEIDWVLILNNDATIPPSYISTLVRDGLSRPTAGMIGSRQAYPPEYKLGPSCGVRLSYNLGAYPFWKYRCGDGTRRANFAPGNSVLIRTAMLRQIGLFDERYFLYSEDVDLSYRALEAGWEILINRDVTATQGVSTSLGGRHSPTYYYYLVRNTLLFLSERLTGWRRWFSTGVFVGLVAAKSITWLLNGKRRNFGAALLGAQHFLKKGFGQAPSI
jgi:GT2 family glycosyltransferase